MKQRTLCSGEGKAKQHGERHHGLEVSAIGFACSGLRATEGQATISRQAQRYLLQAACDFGVTFFDAAEAHEELLGEVIAPLRHRIAVSSTFGPCRRPEAIREMAEASLQRLKVEAIDLFSPGHLAPDVPIEDVAGAVKDLIAQGKVKHFGLCEVDAPTLQRAHKVQTVSVLQAAYAMCNRTVENNGTLQTCEALGIGFIARSSLGHGAMTAAHCETTATLTAMAQRRHATLAQLALAWLLAQKPWVVPLLSTRRVGHLDENLGAADLKLSEDDLRAIDAALQAPTHAATESAF